MQIYKQCSHILILNLFTVLISLGNPSKLIPERLTLLRLYYSIWDVIMSPKGIADVHGIARCLAYEMSILDENRHAGSLYVMSVFSNCDCRRHLRLSVYSVSYFENLIIALIYWAPFWSGHLATCFTYLSFVVLMVALQRQVLFYPFQTLETRCWKQLPWPGLHSWPAAEAESKAKLASL